MTSATAPERHYEGSRALAPADAGYVERHGVRTFYEVYGAGAVTILLMPTWPIATSRAWRAQIPYFARRFRVIVFDPRGNGRSDRPLEPAAYEPQQFALDAFAVLEATGTDRAIVISLSMSTAWSLIMAALQPERVQAAVFLGPTPYGAGEPFPQWSLAPFHERLDSYDGFLGHNRHFIREHYRAFAESWAVACCPEPHSLRSIELGVGMALETTPEVILATLEATKVDDFDCSAERLALSHDQLRPLARGLGVPVLVVTGELDQVAPPHWARALASDTGGELAVVPQAGHVPNARKPVAFNLTVRAFAERVTA
jgi:pimeloyl-ACP methyl ester carboxylesterase